MLGRVADGDPARRAVAQVREVADRASLHAGLDVQELEEWHAMWKTVREPWMMPWRGADSCAAGTCPPDGLLV